VSVAGYRENGIVVTAGVVAGEWIVAAGVHKLRAGQSVRPYEAPGRAVPSAPTVPGVAPGKG